ncbi:MAG: YdiU family protein, partial [Nitrospirota bacterium]|nr:YdiU family protein [Nitrospirota bacterium]
MIHEHYTDLTGNDRLIKTTQENVRSQLDHLRTHPSVAVLLRKKQLDLHGKVYSISTGDAWVYDFEFAQFTSLLDDNYPRLKMSSKSCHAPAMSKRQLETLSFDNTYARLPEAFYAKLNPTPFSAAPYLISFNPAAAELIDLDPAQAKRPEYAGVFGGSLLVPGMEPLAMLYSGHQFGVYVPQLGDGRAILLGEVRN